VDDILKVGRLFQWVDHLANLPHLRLKSMTVAIRLELGLHPDDSSVAGAPATVIEGDRREPCPSEGDALRPQQGRGPAPAVAEDDRRQLFVPRPIFGAENLARQPDALAHDVDPPELDVIGRSEGFGLRWRGRLVGPARRDDEQDGSDYNPWGDAGTNSHDVAPESVVSVMRRIEASRRLLVRNRRGQSGRLYCLVRLNPGRCKRNERAPALLLLLFDIPKDRVQIVMKTGSMSIAHPTNFIDNRVGHGFASKSSSGVQMIGALSPLRAQTDSISGRIVALAKCRQFHVKRQGVP
jgi:hypothetical protein